MHVTHTCDNSLCVNPDHLELGTNADNMEQKARRLRAPAKLTLAGVADIRARYAAGETQASIALDYEVHQGDISHIVNKHYWRHV